MRRPSPRKKGMWKVAAETEIPKLSKKREEGEAAGRWRGRTWGRNAILGILCEVSDENVRQKGRSSYQKKKRCVRRSNEVWRHGDVIFVKETELLSLARIVHDFMRTTESSEGKLYSRKNVGTENSSIRISRFRMYLWKWDVTRLGRSKILWFFTAQHGTTSWIVTKKCIKQTA